MRGLKEGRKEGLGVRVGVGEGRRGRKITVCLRDMKVVDRGT